MNINKISSVFQHSNNSFKGHWGEVKTVGAPYPYEEGTQETRTYYPDRDETIDEINAAYMEKTGRDIGPFPYPSWKYNQTYTMGGINYLIDDRTSWELKKAHLTDAANKAEQEQKFIDAIRYKIRIANILSKQRKYHDQYLVELGMQETYRRMPSYQRSEINSDLMEYNPDLAFALMDKI